MAGDKEHRGDRDKRRSGGPNNARRPEETPGGPSGPDNDSAAPPDETSTDAPSGPYTETTDTGGTETLAGPHGGHGDPTGSGSDKPPEDSTASNKEHSFAVDEDDNLPREAKILVPDYDRFLEGHGQRPGRQAADASEEAADEPTAESTHEEHDETAENVEADEEGWTPLEWEAGIWGAEAVDDEAERPTQKDEEGLDLRHHRFGLRLGRHSSGNLIEKIKARLKKHDPEDDEPSLRETEETEAAEERIEPNERYKEIETYPIRPPYGHIRILFDEETKEYIYQVLEPVLTKTERDILIFIEESLVDSLTVSPHELEDMDDRAFITERFNDVIFDYSIILHEEEEKEDEIKRKLLYYVLRDFIGHGRIDLVMEDPYIEDISCDGPNIPVFLYHRKYESVRSTVAFPSHEDLDSFVIKMAQRSNKHISIAEPILDATLPDGSRLQSTLGKEVSAGGSTFTIRKFRPDPFTPPDLVLFRTMSAEMLAYLWIAVQHSSSVLYAGGTASGKTTSLNAILLFIPPQMKIVTIEDTREVNLPHDNWIAGITRHGFGPRDQYGRQAGEIDMFQLLKNALRQRPEYIIVGEVRGHEAYSLFQAMATGHAAYGTMHADSVDAVIHRLESDPINVPRNLLEALDVVSVQIQTRVGGKRVRRTKQISEIVGIDPHTKEILTNEVFRWVPKDDSFKFSGISYILERIQLEKALPEGSMVRELSRRAAIIEWMIQKRIQDYREVSRIVSAYYREPELVMGLIEGRLSDEEIPSGLREIAQRSEGEDDSDPLSAAALEASKVSTDPDDGETDAAAEDDAEPSSLEPQIEEAPEWAEPEPVAAQAQSDTEDFTVEPPSSGSGPEEPQEGGPANGTGPASPGPGPTELRGNQPHPSELLRRDDTSSRDGPWGSAREAATRAKQTDEQSSPLQEGPDGPTDERPPTQAPEQQDRDGVWGVAPGLLDAAKRHAEAEEQIEHLAQEDQEDPSPAPGQAHSLEPGPSKDQPHSTGDSGPSDNQPHPERDTGDPGHSNDPPHSTGDSPPIKEQPVAERTAEPEFSKKRPLVERPAERKEDRLDRPAQGESPPHRPPTGAPPGQDPDGSQPAAAPRPTQRRRPGKRQKGAVKSRFKRAAGPSSKKTPSNEDRLDKTEALHRAVDKHLSERARKQRPAKDWSPQQAEAWLSRKETEERDKRTPGTDVTDARDSKNPDEGGRKDRLRRSGQEEKT